MTRILLASRRIPALEALLRDAGRRAVLVPTASNPLNEPRIADEVEQELRDAGREVERLDLDDTDAATTAAQLATADVIAVSGGHPFHLLEAARRTGFGDAVQQALERGAIYVGHSAGAMIAAPTLEPLRITSPFSPPPGLDLTGLHLADVLVLPHNDHPGRAARFAEAQRVHGATTTLVPLDDGDVAVIDDGVLELRRR